MLCSQFNGALLLLLLFKRCVFRTNNIAESALDMAARTRAVLPLDVMRGAMGIIAYSDTDTRLAPITALNNAGIAQMSTVAINQHNTAFPDQRILLQVTFYITLFHNTMLLYSVKQLI
jgi:hypothetical protein